jgi:RimJ/RimL family protein N-acetyltransferase
LGELASLYALRLRTPRLELRLGTHDELLQLGRVAERGIHSPRKMPFAVAWTDRIGSPAFLDEFVAYHEQALTAWSSDDWELNLLAWHRGEPIGSQNIGARQFATARAVSTGSWLGAVHQGRGLGTEMRAAVLELAFARLGAIAAVSGWLESGAGQSARVSAKLGYRETATHIESPRGQPVVHHDVRLERDAWHCPFLVRLEGVEPCLPLFGATRE